ncbi:MAG: SDR family NAD(P)-dependent oxidoreductase, partial [Bdellovibrionales bacterium]|nr:SDR family NAD(P)-dependent oxidoreductase [Bdellovibrionales bacterium]
MTHRLHKANLFSKTPNSAKIPTYFKGIKQMDFTNQTVIVTGGTRGIGRGISEAFLKSGATVIATYAGNDLAAMKMKEDNISYGEKIIVKKCDVRDESAVIDFYKYVEETHPKIEVLINNSGIR